MAKGDADGPGSALRLVKTVRRYREGQGFLDILRGADLAIRGGEMVALVAPSGTGKSTLLHVAGLLERPDGGDVLVGMRSTIAMSDAERTRMRREEIGFVYQSHHLLPEFSAIENVVVPQMIRGLGRREARGRAAELLGFLGLGKRLTHRPGELSGGEQQRVAIARALAPDPALVVADEPTGNLDEATGRAVADLLFGIKRERGATLVLVTHDASLAARCDRTVRLRAGQIVTELTASAA